MKTTDYVIYRHGSNAENQSMTQTMPIGNYSGTGRTARERREDACGKAAETHTVYANQWLEAVPAVRVSAEEQEAAWEYDETTAMLREQYA